MTGESAEHAGSHDVGRVTAEERVSTYRDKLTVVALYKIAVEADAQYDLDTPYAARNWPSRTKFILAAVLDRVQPELDRLAAELAVVQRKRDHHNEVANAALRAWEGVKAELAEAQKKIEDLSSCVDRVRDHAYRERRTSQGRVENYVKADDIIALTETNPPPGDTPERIMTEWWRCPNDPPCPHAGVVHDVSGDYEDPAPTCCVEGCDCGRRLSGGTP